MSIEVRLRAAEQHIRDLEDSRAEMLEQFKKNDLVARVKKLEAQVAALRPQKK